MRPLARAPIGRGRLWLFRIVSPLLMPLVFIGFLEAGLRVGGYGHPTGVTIPCDIGQAPHRGDNVRFAWRFFPRNIAQEFDPFVFAATKPAGTYRIFVLGASAAQGTPDPAYSFGRILEVMLNGAHPDMDFEVTVAAMPAVNSHVVIEIARDLVKYDPDLFVVYLGNNEVVGPYGPGTVFSPLSPYLPLIRAGIRLRATRTGQLMAGVVSRLGAGSDAPKTWRGLEMFLDRRVSADDPRLGTVYAHFRQNLRGIRRVAVRSGAHVVFCTVGSNLKDCPPFASAHRAHLTEAEKASWAVLYERAVGRERDGDYSEAIEGYLAAARIDDRFADLHYRLGRCYWLIGEHAKARDRFQSARDLDTLRFRPDRRINEIIRDVATEPRSETVRLLDVEALFRAHSPFGLPGREVFHEHVHLTFHGNYLLARAIFETVEQIRSQKMDTSQAEGASALTESGCADRLAYNAWARYNVLYKVLNYYLHRPPFTHQLYHDEQVAASAKELSAREAALTAEARRQIAGQYRALIEQTPSDIWLRLRYAEFSSVQMNDERTALQQCRDVLSLVPHSYKPRLLAALSLGRLHRFREAVEHLQHVVRLKPTCGQAFYLLGTACQMEGQADKALAHYGQAIKLRPDGIDARRQVAEILLARGELARAERVLREALLIAPDDPGLSERLDAVLRQQGRPRDARRLPDGTSDGTANGPGAR